MFSIISFGTLLKSTVKLLLKFYIPQKILEIVSLIVFRPVPLSAVIEAYGSKRITLRLLQPVNASIKPMPFARST